MIEIQKKNILVFIFIISILSANSLIAWSFLFKGLNCQLTESVNGRYKQSSLAEGKTLDSDKILKDGIAKFYDQSTGVWLDVWGDDLHHGYYPTPDYRDHRQAQREMIERSLLWGYGGNISFSESRKMVDVGCGVGGSSRYIVAKYGGYGEGLSLSPYQIDRANQITAEQKLNHRLKYQVADAMNMPYPDNSFDLVWSMESGEHMPDKRKFFGELFRVAAPGGRIIIVTWCHRELQKGEASLHRWEQKLLNRISKVYYLPAWVPASTYVHLAKEYDLEDVREEDWSEYVLPFWPAVIRSALVPTNFIKMIASGTITIKGAIASLWMRRGLKKGVIKFALITGRKRVH